MRSLLVSAVLLCACADPVGGPVASEAPLTGVDGSADSADRSCHVVLRDLGRIPDGGPGWVTEGSSWVWEGTIEISEAAAAEGAAPAMLYQYGSDPTWWEVAAMPDPGPVTPGFVRYRVRLDDHLPGPGMSGTALTTARVHAIPLVRLAEGGRLFDHNRVPGDLDTYVLEHATGFAVAAAPAVCPATGQDTETGARLVFATDWSETQHGVIVPGGALTIDYDTDRLTTCRHSRAGAPLWQITAHVRWLPSGAVDLAAVRDAPATLAVPADARALEVWFENTSASGCQAWDSNLGANYRFEIAAPVEPDWIGNVVARISRSTDDPCAGGGALDGTWFDTWARSRAAITNACFQVWEPGLTDRDDPDLWQKLDVQVHWRGAGEAAWRTGYVPFDRRVGNDARYAFDLRSIDPFAPYRCPDVPTAPSPDGQYVEAAIELYFTVNAAEVRPAPGAAYAVRFQDYPSNPWRDANCP